MNAPRSPEFPAIPGYRIEKSLGAGAMGFVYLARQESLDRQVALKVLPPTLARDSGYVEGFLKEARSAGKLSHENIVAAVDVGEASGHYFYVMEYVPGKTLAQVFLEESPLPERRALELTRQVARGLEHAHAHGFLHRDIKPSNILLTTDGVAKICDLGLARELGPDPLAGEGRFRGTPAYASPEQCRGVTGLDERSDLYSLGVVAFEMLTGRRPFLGKTAKELAHQQLLEDPPSPRSLVPAISPAAEALVLRLLCKKPEDRYRNGSELLQAIEDALKNPAPKTERARTRRTRRSAGQGRPLAWPALGAVALLLLLGLAVYLVGGRASAPRKEPGTAPAGDPNAERLLEEALHEQEKAKGKYSDYPAVRARWKGLEESFLGTPYQARFADGRLAFEAAVTAEAESLERTVLLEAEASLSGEGILLALARLRQFPDALRTTPSGLRVTARANQIERQVDERFRADVQQSQESLARGNFNGARATLRHLRSMLFATTGPETLALHDHWDPEVEKLLRRVDEADLAARPRPKPEPDRGRDPPPSSSPKSAEGKAPSPPPVGPGTPEASRVPLSPPLAALCQAVEGGTPAQWTAAVTLVKPNLGKSPFYRAADLFLARGIPDWKSASPARSELLGYLSSPTLDPPESLSAAGHEASLRTLAKAMAAAPEAGRKALLPFLSGHLEGILTSGATVDPRVLEGTGLKKDPLLGLWAASEGIDRMELSGLLSRPAAGGAGGPALRALASSDFPTRVLGALLFVRESALDVSAAIDRWKKLAASAPDPSWAKWAEMVADRLRTTSSCEACAGQGKYACLGCGGSGAAPCATCGGTGSVLDDCGGKMTCTTCKGRGQSLCSLCQGAKSVKCSVCDGKKARPTLPGGLFRFLSDLGRCEACSGTGSAFSSVLYPCPRCGGLGRVMDEVPKEFAKLPAWLRGATGVGCYNALRWLALHQSPAGSWGASTWSAACPGTGCEKEPVGGPYDIGVTSLALGAFLGGGLGPDSEVRLGPRISGDVVRRAIDALLRQQGTTGQIATQDSDKPVLEHLLATWALGSSVLATGGAGGTAGDRDRNRLREGARRALQYALDLELKGGGWGYAPSAAAGDTWVTVWGGLALLASKDAGLEVPRPHLTGLLRWLDGVTDRTDLHVGEAPDRMGKVDLDGTESFVQHETLGAAGGFLRLLVEGKPGPGVGAAQKALIKDLPSSDPAARDFGYWHWGTLFMAQREVRRGALWSRWSSGVSRELLPLQETGDTCALGSWLPRDRWGAYGGTVYSTALAALTLEIQSGIKALPKPH
jgi:serine/threonine-protein kinase